MKMSKLPKMRSLKTLFVAMATLSLLASSQAHAFGKAKNGGTTGGVNPTFAGIDGPNFEMTPAGKLVLWLTVNNLSVQGGGEIPLRKFPNSSVYVGPDLNTQALLIRATFEPKDLTPYVSGLDFLDPLTLPGGRALPGVKQGYLPGLALEIEQLNHMVLYVGKTVFGVFFPVKMNLGGFSATLAFYDKKGVYRGSVTAVGQDAKKENSGILALINIEKQVKDVILP